MITWELSGFFLVLLYVLSAIRGAIRSTAAKYFFLLQVVLILKKFFMAKPQT